jgi:hypothetical protein
VARVDLVRAVIFFSRERLEVELEVETSVGRISTNFSISEELILRDFCERSRAEETSERLCGRRGDERRRENLLNHHFAIIVLNFSTTAAAAAAAA